MWALVDTHALLWYALNDPQLSATARVHMIDPAWHKLVSPASYWEIAIKIGTGRYVLAQPYEDFMHEAIEMNGFTILAIEYRHTGVLTTLPRHHGDPFDRLLIAQAMVEQVPIISGDPAFDAYPIRRIWQQPILAEEAGGANAANLEHCRGPGPHVRGCWVVDLLLGKQ